MATSSNRRRIPAPSSSSSAAAGGSASAFDRNWQNNVLCRYFMADACRAGSNCPFSHDRSLSNRGTLPCKYFSQGTCAYGNNCKFSHTKTSSASSSSNDQSRLTSQPPVRQTTQPLAATSLVQPRIRPVAQQPHAVPPPTRSVEIVSPNFQSLTPSSSNRVHTSSFSSDTSWADAPEFVPRFLDESYSPNSVQLQVGVCETVPNGGKTWAQVAELTAAQQELQGDKSWAFVVNPNAMSEMSIADAESQLCPFYVMGECRYNENCTCIHGDICDLCGKAVLHPNHEKQRKQHSQTCMKQIEADMELAFAVARSKDKTCGICMEVIMEKPKSEARFGIMPSCNHCFCLACLRTWRQAKQFEHKIIRACPECRQTSDYVCPSRFWVDTKEEKAKLLADYKDALNKKECKYFNRGQGECPFGNKCFYRHISAEGVDVDVGPPSRRTRRQNADGEIESPRTYLLYNFMEERDGRYQVLPLDLFDILDFLSDSDEADW